MKNDPMRLMYDKIKSHRVYLEEACGFKQYEFIVAEGNRPVSDTDEFDNSALITLGKEIDTYESWIRDIKTTETNARLNALASMHLCYSAGFSADDQLAQNFVVKPSSPVLFDMPWCECGNQQKNLSYKGPCPTAMANPCKCISKGQIIDKCAACMYNIFYPICTDTGDLTCTIKCSGCGGCLCPYMFQVHLNHVPESEASPLARSASTGMPDKIEFMMSDIRHLRDMTEYLLNETMKKTNRIPRKITCDNCECAVNSKNGAHYYKGCPYPRSCTICNQVWPPKTGHCTRRCPNRPKDMPEPPARDDGPDASSLKDDLDDMETLTIEYEEKDAPYETNTPDSSVPNMFITFSE